MTDSAFALTGRDYYNNADNSQGDALGYGLMPLTFPLRAGDLWFGAFGMFQIESWLSIKLTFDTSPLFKVVHQSSYFLISDTAKPPPRASLTFITSPRFTVRFTIW